MSMPAPLPVGAYEANVSVPAPFLFKQPNANTTLLVGCILPFEGNQEGIGVAVAAGLRMGIKELAPKIIPWANINLTCLNTRCQDIPSHAQLSRLADDGAGARLAHARTPHERAR